MVSATPIIPKILYTFRYSIYDMVARFGVDMLTEEDLKRLDWKAPDYGEMTEADFLRLLKAVTDLVELEAIANRKRHLNMPELRGWNNFQRQAILQRKWEILNGRG